jgi:S-adenosylmethionine:tRNA ribosyltransferase-isomerase
VRAARLVGRREGTGGTVELLVLDRRDDGLWDALARPSRRLRRGVRIEFSELQAVIRSEPREGRVVVELVSDDPERAIETVGMVPLPPYFTGHLDDPARYQTMFAATPGSSAAPTAGLHFTEEVVSGLARRGITMATVDLHVSLDTFRPMTAAVVEEHEIHSEWCGVPLSTAQAVQQTRDRGGKVVAVGTTVVRTLESMADGRGGVTAGEGRTDLFLKPGSVFRVVDALVTNFHMPRSTLLVLLAAFMGPRWRTAYRTALDLGYRFLSFGDAMYAERDQT